LTKSVRFAFDQLERTLIGMRENDLPAISPQNYVSGINGLSAFSKLAAAIHESFIFELGTRQHARMLAKVAESAATYSPEATKEKPIRKKKPTG
jgi:hypothetical protein